MDMGGATTPTQSRYILAYKKITGLCVPKGCSNKMLTFLKLKLRGDKTMADKLMYFSNHNKQNIFFCRIQLVSETPRHST